MSTIAGRTYSTPRGINLRDGILRFDVKHSSNPLTNDSTGWGFYVNSSDQLVFWNKTSASVLGTGGSGAGSFDQAYDGGQTVTVDNGAVVFNDASSGAANVLEINKTGAGSGNLIDVDITAAFTGNVINLDMGSGVAAVGIVIDSEAGARTGSDIVFTDDSTGASHTNIEINKSGAGASGIAFKYVGSYNGSPAGQVFNIDLNANDVLDTEVMQLTVGAGARGIMFDFNLDYTDASTTSHVWDIDMGGVFDSNVLDVAYASASTGNTIYVLLDNAVATTALFIEGAGVRTQPMIELFTTSTGSAHMVDVNVAGAISGNVLDIRTSTTFTGALLYLDLNGSTGGYAMRIDGSNEIRTVDLITVVNDGSGNKGVMLITDSNTGSGHVFDIDTSGIGSGNVIDITYSAADTGDALKVVMADNVAGGALVITGAGARTDSIIDVVSSETGSVDGMVLLQTSGVFTGSMLTVHSDGAATTGSLLHLDLDAGVAYKAITFDHAGAREVATILVTFDGTFASGGGGTFLDANISMTEASASPFIDIDVTGVYTGNIVDVLLGAVLAPGTVVKIDLGATATGATPVNLVSGAMTRTTALVKIDDAGTSSGATFDINHTGVSTGIIFDIDATAATTGAVFDYATSAASTGTVFEINMTNAVGAKLATYTLAGTRTVNAVTVTDSMAGAVDVWQVDDSGTKSGHIWDVNVSGNSTGNVLDIVMSSGRVAGHAVHIDLGTDLAGNALLIDAAGVRTAPIIYIANTATDGGTDDHVLFINQTGLLDSNLVQLTFATAASTGEALSITMDTNVAGRAIFISSAGTGVSGEGNALDVTHTGALVAGADVVTLQATGALSSTSNILALESSGAAVAGSFALYIDVANDMEAIKVDTGTVTFDESLSIGTTLAVTGATTLSSTLSYRELTEAVTTTNVITAAESGTTFFLNAVGGFTSTLPAVAAGLNFKFVVKTAPTTAYIITTNAGDNVLYGLTVERAGTAGVAGAARDTVNFVASQAIIGDTYEFTCDGTNWYMRGMVDVAAACTFAVT